jgi:hypothetical protein
MAIAVAQSIMTSNVRVDPPTTIFESVRVPGREKVPAAQRAAVHGQSRSVV